MKTRHGSRRAGFITSGDHRVPTLYRKAVYD
jgi:hypothetical protein